jgi:NAD(P)-dependent dehydrogenase (short-subunit alcohol dehydrogenase family)
MSSKPVSVVVTGASSGIGLGVVGHLLNEGWNVVGLDIDVAPNLDVEGGTSYTHIQGDVRERALHVQAGTAAAALGPLRGWVNCAAIADSASIHLATAEHFEKVIAVNLGGYFWGCSVAVGIMLDTGGSIVNISSGQAIRGRDRYPAYAASKGAILALTTQVAAEYADRQIRCNSIVPGVIVTPLAERLAAAASDESTLRRSWDVMSPIGRLGTPNDVAHLVDYLIGEKSTFMTGAEIALDGGQFVLPPDRAIYR